MTDTHSLSVSVALATFNGERHLAQQLESLVTQRRPLTELVVGDDGSSDATLEMLHDFAKAAPFPVQISHNQRRLGYADNFLATAERCSSDIVAFCDQDDIWRPNKLERVVDVFAQSPECVLTCHYATVVDEGGKALGRRFPRNDLDPVYQPPSLPLVQFPGFSLSVRRSLLSVADAASRPADAHEHVGLMSHDAWLWLLAGCVGEVVVLPDELVLYRQHENVFGDLHVGLRQKVRRLRMADADTYEHQHAHAARLAAYLRVLGDSWADLGRLGWAASAATRAEPYESFAAHAALRAHIYSAPTRREALTRWLRAHRTRQSWTSPNNRSPWSPVKDLVAAVAKSPGLRT